MASDAAPRDPGTGEATIIAKLAFSGSLEGTFMLKVPSSLAQSVSADFLGTAPANLSRDDVVGTVLEMANMLAGGALSIYDSHALFDLQIPELISQKDVDAFAEQGLDGITIRIQTLDSRMSFQLFTQE
jgi:CheY-specific phosphatase CheX